MLASTRVSFRALNLILTLSLSIGADCSLGARRARLSADALGETSTERRLVRVIGVMAVAAGSTRSIADNGSAEGRANNRRVEIVVQPAK